MKARIRLSSAVRLVATAALLLAVATVAPAHLTPPVVVIDGTDVIGGDPDKFACKNLCKQTVGEECASNGVTCASNNINTVCGEKISKVNTVKGCEVDPAGTVDPCTNGRPAAKCYEARNCICERQIKNGQPIYKCSEQNPSTSRGDTVGSANCP